MKHVVNVYKIVGDDETVTVEFWSLGDPIEAHD